MRWHRLHGPREPQRGPESNLSLRTLLAQRGSYSTIAAAVASGRLPHFPVRLFDHVGDVYRRVETTADDELDELPALRLAALVHEEPLESLPRLLESANLSDLAPTVVAVIGGFGLVWKARGEADLRAYVTAHKQHFASTLLFEVAHEGRSTALMERAAELAGLKTALLRWSARLAAATSPDPRL
jgi:hypothetical protein